MFDKGSAGINFAMWSIVENKAVKGIVFNALEKDPNSEVVENVIKFLPDSENDGLTRRIFKFSKNTTGKEYNDIKSWEDYLEKIKNQKTQ